MLKILIVDDDLEIRQALVCLVDALGHNYMAVNNGNEALIAHDAYRPDLIILDNCLGDGISGFSVLNILKKKNTKSQIVMITASGTVEMAVKAMKIGAFDFVQKPFDIDRMEEIFNKVSSMNCIAKMEVIKSLEGINSLEELEKITIKNVIDESSTYQGAADKLGINIVTLHRKRKAYGIQKDMVKDAQQKADKLLDKHFVKKAS